MQTIEELNNDSERNSQRHTIEELLLVWSKTPALRLGQFIYCLMVTGKNHDIGELFYIADDELLARASNYYISWLQGGERIV